MADSHISQTPSWVQTTLIWLAADQWAQQDPNQEGIQVQQRFYAQYQHLVRRDIESPPRSEPELPGPPARLAYAPSPQEPEHSASSEDLIEFSPRSSVDVKRDNHKRHQEQATGDLLLLSPKTTEDDQISLVSAQEHNPDQVTKERKMLPVTFGSVPYTISSESWSLASNSSNTSWSLGEISKEQYAARRKSVVSVYSTVYAVAKIVFVIFQNYGVEVRSSPLCYNSQFPICRERILTSG